MTHKSVPSSVSSPSVGHCSVWLHKKNRYCPQWTRHDSYYCTHHIALASTVKNHDNKTINTHTTQQQDDTSIHKYIQCEYCFTSIYQYSYHHHMEVCPVKQRIENETKQSYYKENMNSGDTYHQHTAAVCSDEMTMNDDDKLSDSNIADITLQQVSSLQTKLQELWNTLDMIDINSNIIDNTNSQQYQHLSKMSATRHNIQLDALTDIVQQHDWLHEGSVLIEMGSGKSSYSAACVKRYSETQRGKKNVDVSVNDRNGNDNNSVNKNKLHVITIDNQSFRHKLENSALRDYAEYTDIVRCRCDIRHVDLSGIQMLMKYVDNNSDDIHTHHNTSIAMIAKHCCGCATDMSLRAAIHFNDGKSNHHRDANHRHHIDGIVIATCCHHRCNWYDYVGIEYMESLNIKKHDFHLMTRLSSWYTCGIDKRLQHDSTRNNTSSLISSTTSGDADNIDINNNIADHMSIRERQHLGYMCKRLIDEGRRHYLRQHGYDASLTCYVNSNITLENTAIIATYRS